MASSKKSRPSKAKSSSTKPEDTTPEDTTPNDAAASETPDTAATDDSDINKDALPEDSVDAPTEPSEALGEGGDGEPPVADVSADAAEEATAKGDDTVADADVEILDPQDADTAPEQQDTPDETKADAADASTAEAVHPVPAPVAAESAPRNNTFLPLVLGGIIAGVIGFAAAELDVFTGPGPDLTAGLREDVAAQSERISALEEAEPPQIDIPEVDFSGIETQLATLEERITELEARPIMTPPEGMDAEEAESFITELSELQRAVRSQREEIEGLIANARVVEEATAEAARAANARAALSKIVSAIDAGQPFPEDLDTLQQSETVEVDPALEAAAEEGVPTLSELQASFPDQARTALAAARANSEDEKGLGGFLKRQLGVRSVTPREGDDPDAVLSRAEAEVLAGDLRAALAELDTLPEAGRSAISDWLSAAQARANALTAADEMAQRLTAD